jgi:hypothetical protein
MLHVRAVSPGALTGPLTSRELPAADHGALRRETAPVWEMVEAAVLGRPSITPAG